MPRPGERVNPCPRQFTLDVFDFGSPIAIYDLEWSHRTRGYPEIPNVRSVIQSHLRGRDDEFTRTYPGVKGQLDNLRCQQNFPIGIPT